jgi:hypothetical protein
MARLLLPGSANHAGLAGGLLIMENNLEGKTGSTAKTGSDNPGTASATPDAGFTAASVYAESSPGMLRGIWDHMTDTWSAVGHGTATPLQYLEVLGEGVLVGAAGGAALAVAPALGVAAAAELTEAAITGAVAGTTIGAIDAGAASLIGKFQKHVPHDSGRGDQ